MQVVSVYTLRNVDTVERAWALDMDRLGFEFAHQLCYVGKSFNVSEPQL